MNLQKQNNKSRTVALGALFTALVIILQILGSAVRFGPFSVSFVLIPIVIGSAVCGAWVGAWLGFVFGVTVILSGDAALFMSVSVFGTVLTVLVKGIMCGLCSGLAYKLLSRFNETLAVAVAAVVCPVANTGFFLIFCRIFFMETIKEWGMAAGYADVGKYMLLGLVGANFLFEMGVNVILSPVAVRLLRIFSKRIR